jgi:L-threonylcarbamoyladenylate synthase
MSNKIEHLKPFVKEISPKAQNIMDKHFPGALTLIFEKTEEVPSYVTSNQNTVGIRIPNNIFFQELCEVIDGHVLATTSANLSGQPPATNYEEALENIGSNVEFVFQDYGQTCKGLSSTVARVLDDEIKIYRQGEVVLD